MYTKGFPTKIVFEKPTSFNTMEQQATRKMGINTCVHFGENYCHFNEIFQFSFLSLSHFLPFGCLSWTNNGQTLSVNIIHCHRSDIQSIHDNKSTFSRINVTMQGGQALAGMQGTNNHMSSGSSQLMVPGFPLKSSQPYSPSRWV